MICYTIGHSTRKLEEFIEIIRGHGIDCVMDIRSNPHTLNDYSRAFHKEMLERHIKEAGINYIYMGDRLGCRNSLSFDDILKEESFVKGINKIVEGIKRGHKIVLMCSERNPFTCHRSILLGYALKKNGVQMEHIIDIDRSKTQGHIEEEIFVTYEPALKSEFVELSIQDILDNDDYDLISEKELKQKVIEEGYRKQFQRLNKSEIKEIRKSS